MKLKRKKVRHSRSPKLMVPYGFKGRLVSCKTARKNNKKTREQAWKSDLTPLNIHRLMSTRVRVLKEYIINEQENITP